MGDDQNRRGNGSPADPAEHTGKGGGNAVSNQAGNGSPREIYASLAPEFVAGARGAVESFQEKGPRELRQLSIYCDSATGIVVTSLTEDKGHIKTIETASDFVGDKPKQRFYFGVQTEADTMDRAIKSASIATRRGAPRTFEVRTQVEQLLQQTIPAAMDAGDKVQRKIDEENYEWFPVFLTKPEQNTIIAVREPQIDVGLLKDMVQIIRDEISDRLGGRAEKIDIVAFQKFEHFIYADYLGSETVAVIPRLGITVQVKTTAGSEAFGAIRGAMGTFNEVVTRFVPDDAPAEARDPRAVAKDLARWISDEANDLDRAQNAGILGTECPVILAPHVAGVLAHEGFGHLAEADIICENRRSKTAKVQLKKRLGAQVTDHPRFSIVDTPEDTIQFEGRTIRFNWGALPVDGYGNRAKPCMIVQNGVMVNAMMDRHTVNETVDGLKDDLKNSMREFGVSGSVRREKYDVPPQIRMRGTFILPDPQGVGSISEMIAAHPVFKQKRGIYMKSCNGGWVNPETGEYEIIGNLCYLIENGQLTNKPIKGVRIHGDIQKISVKALGNASTMHHTFTGYCGKNNQWVPVEGGGPLVMMENAPLAGGSVRPWSQVVRDFFEQHQEVSEGKRAAHDVYIEEFAAVRAEEQDSVEISLRQKGHDRICLSTAVLPASLEIQLLTGQGRDFATHEYDETTKRCVERGKPYERG